MQGILLPLVAGGCDTATMGEMERRGFLGTLGLALVGTACGAERGLQVPPAVGGGGGGGLADPSTGAGGLGGAGGSAPLECLLTDANIEGPYYRPDAPFRDDLTEPGMQGVRVTVSGRVLDADCEPLPGALLDVWQADHSGGYDNDGVGDPQDGAFVLRGRLKSDAEGRYSFKTVHPGHYLNGAQYRPAHIHVMVSAQGHAPLTTQLYFAGDPYNDVDPFIRPKLIMAVEPDGGAAEKCAFDFVLAQA